MHRTDRADCYATEEYDDEDLEIGVQAKEEGIGYLEQRKKKNGATKARIGLWDEDSTLMAVRGITLVQLILERRPYGEDGPKWYHRWTFKLIVVLQINLSDGISSVWHLCTVCRATCCGGLLMLPLVGRSCGVVRTRLRVCSGSTL